MFTGWFPLSACFSSCSESEPAAPLRSARTGRDNGLLVEVGLICTQLQPHELKWNA